MVNSEGKPHIIAREYGHSTKDWLGDFTTGNMKPGDDMRNHPLKLLLEETRANVKGYRALKKLNPNEKTLRDSKHGFINCEKAYLEDTWQRTLKSLKN